MTRPGAKATGRWRSEGARGPIRRAAAFLVAGSALAVVVGWLLLENYRSTAQRREDLLREHAATLVLQAAVLANVLDSAEGTLRSAAESLEVGALLESLELGMSEQYGLGLSRATVRDRLHRLTRPGSDGEKAILDQVTLIDGSGREIAGSGPSDDSDGATWEGLAGEPDGVVLSPDGVHLVALQRVVRSGKPTALVVGRLAPGPVAQALVHRSRAGPATVHSHLLDSRAVAYRATGLRHGAPIPPDAQGAPPDGMAMAMLGGNGEGAPLLVARVQVPGRKLYLVDVHPSASFFQGIRSQSASANLAAAVALALGAVILGVVVNVQSLVRRIRQEDSSAHEREVEEKNEELEREAAERHRVERSRAVLANALEQSADAVAIADTSLRIEHVNPAFGRLTRRATTAVVGRHLLEALAPEAAATPDGQAMLTAIREGRPWRGELAGTRADGVPFDARVSLAPVRDPDGTLTHHVLSARDVTDERREQEGRRHAQRLEAIGTLAGGIAHDFNNILTAINGYSAMALEHLRPGDPLRDDLEEIRQAGERAAELTRQLLAFGRRQVLKPESIDPSGVVEGIQKMLGRVLGATVDLVIDLQPGVWRIRADRGQVEQVLVNLAVNARDAMPAGGRLAISTSNVTISASEARRHVDGTPGDFVRLRVGDTGVGMTPEITARVFEPFFTTKEPGKGTGLGLSTVYGIVRQSQGFLGVASAPGAGTTFDVFLPRDPEPAVAPAPRDGPSAGRQASGQLVLVVEDEDQIRSLILSQLTSRGYGVLSSADGREALRIAEGWREPIALLLTDVVMPRMSGPELARKLRRVHPETAILFMSGYAEEAVLPRDGSAPIGAFLGKPFGADELCARVAEILGVEGPRSP